MGPSQVRAQCDEDEEHRGGRVPDLPLIGQRRQDQPRLARHDIVRHEAERHGGGEATQGDAKNAGASFHHPVGGEREDEREEEEDIGKDME